MADVNKASDLILDHVDNLRLALGEQPYLAKNDPLRPMDPNEEVPFKNAAIFKTRSGDYAIRATYDGVDLGIKPIEKSTAPDLFPAYRRKGQGIVPKHDRPQALRIRDCRHRQISGKIQVFKHLTNHSMADYKVNFKDLEIACRH